jgi:hypothetical protein
MGSQAEMIWPLDNRLIERTMGEKSGSNKSA